MEWNTLRMTFHGVYSLICSRIYFKRNSSITVSGHTPTRAGSGLWERISFEIYHPLHSHWVKRLKWEIESKEHSCQRDPVYGEKTTEGLRNDIKYVPVIYWSCALTLASSASRALELQTSSLAQPPTLIHTNDYLAPIQMLNLICK